jgi:thioester reductase-like protein
MNAKASAERRVAVVTGFPTAFLARRVLRRLLQDDRHLEVRCVVLQKYLEQASEELERLEHAERRRVEVIEGDTAAMDLGLSGAEFGALAGEVNVIHHCAAITYLGVDDALAEQVNVGGTREVLELADAAQHLDRLVLWSTALVSGARRGYVLEDELEAPAGFRNAIEETRFRAERLVRRASARIPTTILRPSIVVGDSVTGEIDRFEGPYLLVLLMLNSPVDLRMPMPGRGETPLNLVPVDYVVDAGCTIASDPRSVGRTFHLVDPRPHTARKVFELIARAAGRPVPRGFVPANLATALLRTPGLERFAHVPRAFLEQLATEVVYDDRHTRELLGGRGIECPPFESYVDVLVQHVREQQKERRARHAERAMEEDDPLG